MGDYLPRFGPDGRSLALVRSPNIGVGGIHRLQLSATLASEGKRITFENRFPSGFAWTPDGNEFLFSSTRDGPV